MKKLTAVLCLTFASAPILSAQVVTLTNGGVPPVQEGSFLVGNYGGLLGSAPVTLNCVDFFHQVTINEQWQANALNIGTTVFTSANSYYGGTTNYRDAAFLTMFYNAEYAEHDYTEVKNIQNAIWRLTDSNNPSDPRYGSNSSLIFNSGSDYWVNCVNSNVCEGKDKRTVDYTGFVLLHPTEKNAQEMIITTPEPSSIALLGTGLFGLVPMIRRRRKA